jgi:hypothetical protein
MVQNPRTAAGAGGVSAVGRFRPLNEPSPVAVEATPRGGPKAVLWRGNFLDIRAIHDTWRIDDEWWREEIARRYFLVELTDGRRLTLYRDLVKDLWYAQPYETPRAGGATQRKSTA